MAVTHGEVGWMFILVHLHEQSRKKDVAGQNVPMRDLASLMSQHFSGLPICPKA